jgi:hypothetical protein
MTEFVDKTTRELYEDWKPLLEAEQDSLVTQDIEHEIQEATYSDQIANRGPGISAGGPIDPGYQTFPLLKKQTVAVERAKQEFPDDEDC